MKIKITFFLAVLINLPLMAQEISFPEKKEAKSNFELRIENIQENKGEVRIAIFDSREKYDNKKNPIHAVVIPVEGDTLTWNDDLSYGDYAIAVYHDKNTNGELDTNLLGIPKEAYGFSNNARGRFGPASWDDAHFTVSSNQTRMVIDVK